MEPSSAERRLLAIHAHPDDESITTGGLLARCADAGVRTRLVTCTDGRYGPVNPGLGLTLTPDELAEVRRKELGTAAKVLGVAELDWLGYHDSGMMGSPNNQRSQAFWAEPLQKLVERVVRILRHFRPHMLVTYDSFGCTGHPDHIQAHRIALLAVEGAAEPHLFPDTGAPWAVSHVFYPVFPMSAMERFIDEELRTGRPHPFDGRSSAEINYTRPDVMVTHEVDIGEVYERKRMALHAHRTQVGSHYPQLYRAALARREHEHFRLALGRPAESDVDAIFAPATRRGV
ncbi:MAG: PIG-L family deacetylase [Pseudonocardiaceae bacterium]